MINYIDTLLKEHPKSVSLYKKKGYALILDMRNDEAIEVLTAARNIDSSDAVSL